MSNYQNDLDPESDELIEILVDKNRTSVERTRATQQLYHRHTSWVIQQVGKKIYNPDDVQDIAQTVWMMVLQPEKLAKDYKNKNGKFRAYLRAPIRWAILKHIDKLPFTTNDAGEKAPVLFTDVDEAMLEESLDSNMLEGVIENIIKPNLKSVDIKSRNVYVVNEYDVIFETDPSLSEVASVYLPTKYKTLVDPVELNKSSGRYLANLIGISESAFRKRLHGARKFLLETVRQSLLPIPEGSGNG